MLDEYCVGYQEFFIKKTDTIRHALSSADYLEYEEPGFQRANVAEPLTMQQRHECLFMAAGTCMLAQDKSIVEPVILNKHRKDYMTPAEIADYAERAISRTGRVGFEVGKQIERMKATIHYRNGCFAKYYVGKDHECYPANAELSKVPIIKWRSGAIVNKDNVPKVPTGFKDEHKLE